VNELGSLYVGQVPRPVKNHENAYRVLCSFPSLSRLPTAAPHPAAAVSPLRSPPSSRKEKPPPGAHRSPTTADPKFRTPEPRLPAQAPTECDGSASAAAPAPFAYLPLSRSRTPKSPMPSLNYYNILLRLSRSDHLLQWAAAAENSLFFFWGSNSCGLGCSF
jgi:hypothetical protein